MSDYDKLDSYVENTGAVFSIRSIMNKEIYSDIISFPAFVTSYSDSFTSTWNTEHVYGRQDPIGTFQGTARVISLSFDVVGFTKEEARTNMEKINSVSSILYPSYSSGGNALSLSKAPLLEVKYSNLIHGKRSDEFLLGWFSSFTINPSIEMGMFVEDKMLFPKVYNVSLTFNPQHVKKLGVYNTNPSEGAQDFPFKGG